MWARAAGGFLQSAGPKKGPKINWPKMPFWSQILQKNSAQSARRRKLTFWVPPGSPWIDGRWWAQSSGTSQAANFGREKICHTTGGWRGGGAAHEHANSSVFSSKTSPPSCPSAPDFLTDWSQPQWPASMKVHIQQTLAFLDCPGCLRQTVQLSRSPLSSSLSKQVSLCLQRLTPAPAAGSACRV